MWNWNLILLSYVPNQFQHIPLSSIQTIIFPLNTSHFFFIDIVFSPLQLILSYMFPLSLLVFPLSIDYHILLNFPSLFVQKIFPPCFSPSPNFSPSFTSLSIFPLKYSNISENTFDPPSLTEARTAIHLSTPSLERVVISIFEKNEKVPSWKPTFLEQLDVQRTLKRFNWNLFQSRQLTPLKSDVKQKIFSFLLI